MADKKYFLNSKATGTWEYEIQEGKTKVKYPINLGFNEILESHRKTLEDDPGYKARIKKGVYKELKPKEALQAGQKDEKSIDKAKDVSDAKDLYKTKISELKDLHKEELKKVKVANQEQIQQLVDSRGGVLEEVKILKEKIVTLSGEFAGTESELKKALVIAKGEFDDLVLESSKEIESLKVSSEKKIKALEGEKKALEKQIKDLKEKVK